MWYNHRMTKVVSDAGGRVMFSVADIREAAYGTVCRRGKDIYETGGVADFSYEVYLEHDLPKAEITAKVRGNE